MAIPSEMSSTQETSSSTAILDGEKDLQHVKITAAQAPHPSYYDRGGMRTYGDDEDHDHEPPMTLHRFMGFLAMAILGTNSQVPIWLFGAVGPYIYQDIGGVDRFAWFFLANLLAQAGILPFVGSISDMIGRRWVAIIGASVICVGVIISSTAKNIDAFIGGMGIVGVGAGICELTALAATSEMAPTRKRGMYVAVLITPFLPWCASALFAQLLAYHASWRYVGVLCGVWSAIALVMTLIFYHPPPRINSKGLRKMEVIQRIDFIGGIISVAGLILFLMGLVGGGFQYPWKSAHILVPLILGFAMVVAFCFWEMYGTKHPMFPGRLKQEPLILFITLVITFISGANYFSIIVFWPTQSFNVYGQDPVQVGIRALPLQICIVVGAFIALWLLSVFRGHNREIVLFSSVLMTAGCASLAAANVDNLNKVWGLVIIAGLGIGGNVIPASIIATVICPDDLIATVTALTLTIRILGGCVGYAIYYNLFVNKFTANAVHYVGGAMKLQLGISNRTLIKDAIELTAISLIDGLKQIPGIAGNDTAFEIIVRAGRVAFAESYKWVYYVSIAFGAASITAACFLGNIDEYMDDHVAVVVH